MKAPAAAILFARKQEGHIDWYSGEDRFFDCRKSLLRSRNLDKEVRSPRAPMEILRFANGGCRVVGQQRRDLEGYPAVDGIRLIVNRAEQIRRPGHVRKRQIEEDLFAGPAPRQ